MSDCWPSEFRREHEKWIAHYPPREQNELREAREDWMRREKLPCCKESAQTRKLP